MTDLASQNTLQRSQIDMLREELEELDNQVEFDYNETTRIYDLFWGLLYPDHPKGWEYPGQILDHLRLALQEKSNDDTLRD